MPYLLLLPGAPLVLAHRLYLRQVSGILELSTWLLILGLVTLVSYRRPVGMLTLLPLAVILLPYLRHSTAMGKSLPLFVGLAVVTGTSIRAFRGGTPTSKGIADWIAPAVAAFAGVLLAATIVGVIRFSPAVRAWLPHDGSSSLDLPFGSSSLPLFRMWGLLLGPAYALILMRSVKRLEDTRRRGVQRRLVSTLIIGATVSLLMAAGQLLYRQFPLPSLAHQASGAFHNPTGLALVIVLVTPLALVLVRGWTSRPRAPSWWRWFALVTLALVAFVVFQMPTSRTAQGGMLASISILLLGELARTSRGRSPLWKLLVVLAALCVPVLILLTTHFVAPGVWQPYLDALGEHGPLAIFGDRGRLETTRSALLMAADQPVSGWGITGFEAMLGTYYERHGTIAFANYHASNNHLAHMLADLGLIGLLANLWMLWRFLYPVWARSLVVTGDAHARLLALGAASGSTTVLLSSAWVGENMYAPEITIPLFAILVVGLLSDGRSYDGVNQTLCGWLLATSPALYLGASLLGV